MFRKGWPGMMSSPSRTKRSAFSLARPAATSGKKRLSKFCFLGLQIDLIAVAEGEAAEAVIFRRVDRPVHSVLRRHVELSWQDLALVVRVEDPFGQGDLFVGHVVVRDLCEQVVDAVQPRPFLSLPSTIYHGASEILVRANVSSFAFV